MHLSSSAPRRAQSGPRVSGTHRCGTCTRQGEEGRRSPRRRICRGDSRYFSPWWWTPVQRGCLVGRCVMISGPTSSLMRSAWLPLAGGCGPASSTIPTLVSNTVRRLSAPPCATRAFWARWGPVVMSLTMLTPRASWPPLRPGSSGDRGSKQRTSLGSPSSRTLMRSAIGAGGVQLSATVPRLTARRRFGNTVSILLRSRGRQSAKTGQLQFCSDDDTLARVKRREIIKPKQQRIAGRESVGLLFSAA